MSAVTGSLDAYLSVAPHTALKGKTMIEVSLSSAAHRVFRTGHERKEAVLLAESQVVTNVISTCCHLSNICQQLIYWSLGRELKKKKNQRPHRFRG